MDEEPFDCMGRINLPPPDEDALQLAAEDVLGPDADEAPFPEGGKVFRGAGGLFIQGPGDPLGESLATASREMQEALMAAARKVRKIQAEVEGADYIDPSKNEMIRFPDED
jgi:hypothetical protein